MENQKDIIIVGGGMIGMTQALMLAREHCTSCMIERGKWSDFMLPSFDGRVSAIAHGSAELFQKLDIWQHMQPHAQPIWDIRIVDGDMARGDSSLTLHYDHSEVGDNPLGYIIENRHIRAALINAVKEEPRITCEEGVSITAMHSGAGQRELTLSDGRNMQAPLVIAADGKQSRLRDMAGLSRYHKRYPQQAIVCTVTHEQPHEGVAVERFLPSGPFAILPLTDDEQGRHRSSLVWTESSRWAKDYMALDESDFTQEVQRRFGDWLGSVQVSSSRWSYPLSLSYAHQLYSERLALVGDAAHAIHPIAGQGVNLGFRDTAVLADIIGKAKKLGLDIGAPDLLQDYASQRQFDMHAMIAATDKLNALFSTSAAPVRLARRLGLAAVEKMPFAKHMLMRHAMGVLLPLPGGR